MCVMVGGGAGASSILCKSLPLRGEGWFWFYMCWISEHNRTYTQLHGRGG